MRSSIKPSDFVIRFLTTYWSYDQAGSRSKLRLHSLVFCLQSFWHYFRQIYSLQASKDERIWAQIGFNSETATLTWAGIARLRLRGEGAVQCLFPCTVLWIQNSKSFTTSKVSLPLPGFGLVKMRVDGNIGTKSVLLSGNLNEHYHGIFMSPQKMLGL